VQVGEQVNGNSSVPDFTQVAFLPDGSIVIAGAPAELRFAGSDLTDPNPSPDLTPTARIGSDDDALVAALDRSGTLRWFHRVSHVGWDNVNALQVDAGRIFVGLELDYYEVYSRGYRSSSGHSLGVLMALDSQTGAELWSRDLEQNTQYDNDDITSLARAADGTLRVVVACDLLRVQVPPQP
jgi:hypothetical protein